MPTVGKVLGTGKRHSFSGMWLPPPGALFLCRSVQLLSLFTNILSEADGVITTLPDSQLKEPVQRGGDLPGSQCRLVSKAFTVELRLVVLVKRNSHYSSFPRSSNPVEKQHSMASQERTILQESKSFDVFCTCLLKAGGREMGSGPPADPHPIAVVYGERQDSRQCTVPRAGSPARA